VRARPDSPLVTDLSHWTEFAVTLAGVAAVLAGLVFVALSVNLERILRVAGLPGRAGETVVVFIGAVVHCAFLLIPDLGRVGVGVGLLVAGTLEWAIITAVTVAGIRQPTAQPWHWNLTRVVGGQIATVRSRSPAFSCSWTCPALYWLAAAVLWAVVASTANAWVLIVEVARDAHYLPLDDHEADRSPTDDAEERVGVRYPTAQALWNASA
jgi:hypothetical protein